MLIACDAGPAEFRSIMSCCRSAERMGMLGLLRSRCEENVSVF
jgi:hypothetical protein